MGEVCYKIWDVGYEVVMVVFCDVMGDEDFIVVWVEGVVVFLDEVIVYV